MVESLVEILGVTFLTPALINLKLDGQEMAVPVNVDIVNRKVYSVEDATQEFFSEEVFNYLDSVNTLPEDFFMAPDDIIERATAAQIDYESLRQQHAEK